MALDGTYAGLQTSVNDFLNRSDLLSSIPDFIRLAEAQMNRRMRCSQMISATTLVVSTASTALPADFNGMVAFELPTGTGGPLRYVRPEELRAQKQTNYASTGTPLMWSIIGTNLETAPAPSGSLTCTLAYYQRIPALTTSATANWLLTRHPDVYLYGTLLQTAPYLKDDARLEAWGTLYEKALADIITDDGRTSFGHGLTPQLRATSSNLDMAAPAAP